MTKVAKALSRADEIGLKTKYVRRRVNKVLADTDWKLVEIAGQFGDADQNICNRIDEFRTELADLKKELLASLDWLDLPPGEEPEAGTE